MSIERLEDIKNPKDKELVKLLQELVRIPSWIPDDPELRQEQNENQLVEYLEQWIKKHTDLKVERQELRYGRFNLIASKGKPDLIFLAHTDTVAPSTNAPYDQLAAEIHDGKIWGRGTTDMKSGIASMLQALKLSPDVDNVWLFLYADEEYDFLGMKALVKDYSDLRPKLIVSSDGSDLQFGHGCRGLIEFRVRVYGETGHPAMGTGKNAIIKGLKGISSFQEYINEFEHPEMGKSNLNIAYVLGGSQLEDSFSIQDDGERKSPYLQKVGQAGNVVPDVMEFKVEIRPGTPDLSFKKAVNKLEESVEDEGLGFELVEKVHEYGAWYTNIEDLQEFVDLAGETVDQTEIEIQDPGESGYLDLQMLWEATGRPPSFMFGGGVGRTAHKPDEHIGIEELVKTRDFFKRVLEKHHKNL